MPAVLILGGRAPVALDHARRFARQGWTVYAADSIPCRGTTWSTHVHAGLRLPPPRSEPLAYAKAVARAVAAHGIDLLLPTCEEVFYVSRYRAHLPRELRVVVDDIDTLTALHSKFRFMQLAADCGARVPDGRAVATLAEAREWAVGRPVVLKPEFSRFGVYVRVYPRGIPADAAALADQGRWVVQELCAGDELCSYGVAVDGRLTAHVAYRPLYRLSRSSSYYFDPVEAPAIRNFVEQLVRKTRYTGQISFDWIRSADGQFTVLECNPRAISGLHLFAATDALPAAVTGAAAAVVEPSETRARMLAVVMLTAGLAASIRAGRVAAWRSDFRRAQDVLAEPGDRGPLPGSLADLCLHTARALRRRSSVRAAATADIEWDGEELPEW